MDSQYNHASAAYDYLDIVWRVVYILGHQYFGYFYQSNSRCIMRPTLKNWGFDGCGLVGEAYNYPDKPDGWPVCTSRLIEIHRDGNLLIAVCKSREYILENVAANYEAMFPNAVQRLLARFEHKLN